MLSEKIYWIILIVAFAGFALSIWLVLIPYEVVEYNLGVNLFTSSIFMVLTVIFLSLLANLRERREWKNVETWVKRKMGEQLYYLFNILARVIYPKQFSPDPPKEQMLTILKALNEMKEATLTEYAYNYFPKPLDDLSVYQLDVLFRFKRYLSDLETKYFRFFKSEICLSLMEIQTLLNSIEADFSLVKRFEGSQNVVEKSMSESILRIMKEIYKLHKMGIEIYPKQIIGKREEK